MGDKGGAGGGAAKAGSRSEKLERAPGAGSRNGQPEWSAGAGIRDGQPGRAVRAGSRGGHRGGARRAFLVGERVKIEPFHWFWAMQYYSSILFCYQIIIYFGARY